MSGRQRLIAKIRAFYGRDWLVDEESEVSSALRELFSPDVVVVPEPELGPAYTGIDELRRLLIGGRREWKSCRYLLEQVEGLNDSGLLVAGRIVADLRVSGARVSFPFAQIWRIRQGLVERLETYSSLAEARRAARSEV